MRQRLITSLVGLAVFFAVLYGLPVKGIVMVFALLCAIASFEMCSINKGLSASKSFMAISAVMGGLVPIAVVAGGISYVAVLMLVHIAVISIFAIIKAVEFTKGRFIQSFFGTFVLIYLLSAVIKIFIFDENGKLCVLLPFAIAWLTDVFAQQVGMRFGKKKLCPKISPKKTVAGSVGGLFGGVFGAVAIGLIFPQIGIGVWDLILMGFFGSIISQIGDLSMSMAKRLNDVKDFGNIFPGHGGVLDRFDSVMLAAPFVELILRNLDIM